MGIIDIEYLSAINKEIKLLTEKYDLPFKFETDKGTYETAIEFVGSKPYHPPFSKDWSTKPVIFCPDLLDWHNKIIIEYEEEIGDRKPGAALAKKGHHREGDMDNKKDTRRGKYYKSGGFHVLRIWECDPNWHQKLETFLTSISIEYSISIE